MGTQKQNPTLGWGNVKGKIMEGSAHQRVPRLGSAPGPSEEREGGEKGGRREGGKSGNPKAEPHTWVGKKQTTTTRTTSTNTTKQTTTATATQTTTTTITKKCKLNTNSGNNET